MVQFQHANQVVEVNEWNRESLDTPYPEGARDKALLYCSNPSPYKFLSADHLYLFKRSRDCFPEQFWVEIFAYNLGIKMDVSVPPAFVAYDCEQKFCGALIEWFLSSEERVEEVVAGGDLCQQYILNFDRKKGIQHNFKTIVQIFEDLQKRYSTVFLDDWVAYWAKVFVFDALIGNTDRHQDNWSIIRGFTNDDKRGLLDVRISPVFDNGTSMGHEVFSKAFGTYTDEKIEQYVSHGRHHMKWDLADSARLSHIELLLKFIDAYPKTRDIMLECLFKANTETFKSILDYLASFKISVRLSHERAHFMLRLLQFRHDQLIRALEPRNK